MKDFLLWRKMARITALLGERLGITAEKALGVFLKTDTCAMLHTADYGLQTMSDAYIVDEIIIELNRKANKNFKTDSNND